MNRLNKWSKSTYTQTESEHNKLTKCLPLIERARPPPLRNRSDAIHWSANECVDLLLKNKHVCGWFSRISVHTMPPDRPIIADRDIHRQIDKQRTKRLAVDERQSARSTVRRSVLINSDALNFNNDRAACMHFETATISIRVENTQPFMSRLILYNIRLHTRTHTRTHTHAWYYVISNSWKRKIRKNGEKKQVKRRRKNDEYLMYKLSCRIHWFLLFLLLLWSFDCCLLLLRLLRLVLAVSFIHFSFYFTTIFVLESSKYYYYFFLKQTVLLESNRSYGFIHTAWHTCCVFMWLYRRIWANNSRQWKWWWRWPQ